MPGVEYDKRNRTHSTVTMHIESLHIYPVKSMRAVDLTNAAVDIVGLRDDRRWLVVDADGQFLTQRGDPALATITATASPSGVRLSARRFGEAEVLHPSGETRQTVTIWGSEVDAAVADERANAFVSRVLGKKARLVFMDDEAKRLKESVWTDTPEPVSFADGYPVLVTTTGSLDALNLEIEARGGEAIGMARFRPNIVIDCDEPWAEDAWTQLQIGEVTLELVKPCDRCIVTTTDQVTGEIKGKEPLASLTRIRRSTDPRIKGVLFGVNAVPRALGKIQVGDPVRVTCQAAAARVALRWRA